MNSLEYIRANRNFLNLAGIEKAAKIRPTMLHRYIKQGRAKAKVIQQLDKVIIDTLKAKVEDSRQTTQVNTDKQSQPAPK